MWNEASGISTEWLLAEASTAGPILWAQRHLNASNSLQDHVIPDQLLTDEEIEQELKLLFDTGDQPLCFIVDRGSLMKEERKIEQLKEQIERSSCQLDKLQKFAAKGSELDLKASKELEYYKSLKALRNSELADLTLEFKELSNHLNMQKMKLLNNINETADAYLAKGQCSENQINVNLFDDYFLESEHLTSSLRLILNDFKNDGEKKKEVKSTDVDALLKSNELIEKRVATYARVKIKLNTSKEFLKFLLTRKENCHSLIGSYNNTAEKWELENNEMEFKLNISEFVKRQTAFLLLGELNSKLETIEFTLEKLNTVSSIILSLLTCSEIILSSLKSWRNNIDDIIFSFFSTVISLMKDIDEINIRNGLLEQSSIKLSYNLSQQEDQAKFLKKYIYKVLLLKDETPKSSAKKVIDSITSIIPKIQQTVINCKSKELLLQYEKLNRKSIHIKNFIWDGATSQPNIFNKEMEINLYKSEKQNECDNETVKQATNKYIQLKSNFQNDTTLKEKSTF